MIRICTRGRRAVILFSAVLVLIGGLANCGGSVAVNLSPSTLVSSLPLTRETTHFSYHYSQGDSVDAERNEAWLAWASALLGVQPAQKVQYYKYASTAQMQQITGVAANGWADPPSFSIHTIWPWDNHETVHLLTALVGRPSDFFNEGIAVSLQTDPFASDREQPLWHGQPLDTFARAALQQGRLPHIQDIADTAAFRALPDNDSYPWAGSFMQFLAKRYGMSPMLAFFRGGGGREESRSTILARFQQVYGLSLSDADLAWREYLLP